MAALVRRGRPTPSEDELSHLLLPLATTEQINDAEARNIDDAMMWALRRRRRLGANEILTINWLKALHLKMYGDVWDWAGIYRQIQTNIGTSWWLIESEFRDLLADATYWLADATPGAYGSDEAAIRFSHRVVKIHPFVNGNGRWSRLVGDVLVISLGEPAFTWGGGSLQTDGLLRENYIQALEAANNNFDYGPLIKFARS